LRQIEYEDLRWHCWFHCVVYGWENISKVGQNS